MRLIAFFAVLFMIAALFVGGSQPGAGSLFPTPFDKLVHVTYFFVVSFLLIRFARVPIAWAILFTILVGTLDELHQAYLPGRQAGFDDWLADVFGIGLCLIVHQWCLDDRLRK